MPADSKPDLVELVEYSGKLALIHCDEPFTFAPGHPNRSARCPVCRELIADRPAAVIGVAVLDQNPCECGAMDSETLLIHFAHIPISFDELKTAVSGTVKCRYQPGQH